MASNPAFGVLSPRFSRILRSDSQNVEEVNKHRKRNKFDYSDSRYDTYRFGEVRPFFHMYGLPNDSVTLNSKHELWTHVLKSPLMSDLSMYKDYFYVPFKAILPNSWDSFISTPVQGDDVPDDAYCYLNFGRLGFLVLLGLTSENAVNTPVLSYSYVTFEALCRELVFSSGSLLNQFGINIHQLVVGKSTAFYYLDGYSSNPSIDSLFDRKIQEYITSVNPGNVSLRVYRTADSSEVFPVVLDNNFQPDAYRAYIYAILSGDLVSPSDVSDPDSYAKWRDVLKLFYKDLWGANFEYCPFAAAKVYEFDISPVIAYQLVGSQFYVNDNVDPLFTARQWIDNFRSTINVDLDTFDYNGSPAFYDVLSAHTLNSTLSNISFFSAINFVKLLFAPFESLRYGDYFTGSRLSPLAVGADSKAVAPVTASEVSAVDITKSIAWQNFLNDVMKLGPVQWIQQNGIFGEMPSTLDPMPRFISREKVGIGAQNIENTADSQGEIVSRMRSTSGDYAFNISLSEHCIILGLVSFDIPRIYQNVTERFAFTYDREDFFNPYFQNIGDQGLYLAETDLSKESSIGPDTSFEVFSWQIRDTQYKQRVSRACGAFVGNYYLPSWAFIDSFAGLEHLTSEFIRNHNYEFDRFYESLPNVGAGYFHFYMRIRNNCEAVRAMQYRPGIQLPLIHQ